MQACGDVPAAVVNAALGNLVGSAVAPALARVLIGGQSVGSNTGATAVKLLGQIFLPLAAGVATQLAAHRFRPAAHARLRTSRASGAASGLLLFALMYLIFCKAFAGGGSELTARSLGLLAAWVSVLHLVLFAAAWAAGGAARFSLPRRIMFAMIGSQKTEGTAIAILGVIFSGSSSSELVEYTIPVVMCECSARGMPPLTPASPPRRTDSVRCILRVAPSIACRLPVLVAAQTTPCRCSLRRSWCPVCAAWWRGREAGSPTAMAPRHLAAT
jgi:predicted Na+-dependent transporter